MHRTGRAGLGLGWAGPCLCGLLVGLGLRTGPGASLRACLTRPLLGWLLVGLGVGGLLVGQVGSRMRCGAWAGWAGLGLAGALLVWVAVGLRLRSGPNAMCPLLGWVAGWAGRGWVAGWASLKLNSRTALLGPGLGGLGWASLVWVAGWAGL